MLEIYIQKIKRDYIAVKKIMSQIKTNYSDWQQQLQYQSAKQLDQSARNDSEYVQICQQTVMKTEALEELADQKFNSFVFEVNDEFESDDEERDIPFNQIRKGMPFKTTNA